MKREPLLWVMITAGLALSASGCRPDLTAGQPTVKWDNSEQSASFTLKNRGATAAAAFDVQLILVEYPTTAAEIVYTTTVDGLAAGETVEFQNLSLRHLLRPENDCLGRVREAVLYIDSGNSVRESNEGNNRKAVKVPAISTACDEVVRFEALPMGIEFIPISHIASDGIGFAIRALPQGGGFATIRNDLGVGNGQVLWLKNAWLEPKICQPRHFIAFDAGYYGGDIYLEVNGDTGNSPYPGLAAVNGADIGGVRVEVSGDGQLGAWQFKGVINSMKIGGQELAIDNILFWTQQKRML